MVLSKRERVIVIVAAIVVAAFILDRVVLDPYFTNRQQASDTKNKLRVENTKNENLINLKGHVTLQWKEMQKSIKSEPAEAETQVMHAIQSWAQQSGFGLSNIKPDRPADKTRMPEILFQADGSGNNKSFHDFLSKLESAPMPLKVLDIQVGTPREGMDELAVKLKISTLYMPKRPAAVTEPATAITRGN